MSRRDYPLEPLLRPPVELWPATVAFLGALIALAAPWALMMTPGVAWGAAAVLILVSAWQLQQGLQVLRYQRRLCRLPDYTLKTARIPFSRQRLFLGRGFEWSQVHTQRLRDTRRPEVQVYLSPGYLYRWARRCEIRWERLPLLCWLARLLAVRAWWNPLAPLPAVGGRAQIHAVEPDERAVWMPLAARAGHTLVEGTTQVGKTRLAELLIAQDIRRGDTVIVIDPKGDAALLQRVYAESVRAGRAGQFVFFHLGYPDVSARYNAVGSFGRITEVANRIASQLPRQGDSAAFAEFGWRFVNLVARALVALGRRPDYRQIARHITNIEPLFLDYWRHWAAQQPDAARRVQQVSAGGGGKRQGRSQQALHLARAIREQDLFDPVLDGLRSAIEYDKTYFDKIVASLLPLLEKLTTGPVAELIAPDYFTAADPRPIFDWRQVIRTNSVVYVGLDALSDATVASAVGSAMFADLVSVAGELYKHGLLRGLPEIGPTRLPVTSLHADEFNENLCDEFIPLLNKGAAAGFQVTAYTQTLSDIEVRVGSRPKAGQVIGNFNNLILFRVRETATAELLTEQLPTVTVRALMPISGSQDSSAPGTGVEFTSHSQDRVLETEVPLLTPADIVTLPKGQAFAFIDGGRLYKLRTPLFDSRRDVPLPARLRPVAGQMARGYRSGERWWISAGFDIGRRRVSGR